MIQTQENDEKPHFGLHSRIFLSEIWLRQSLDIIVSYHLQYQEKTDDPILRKFSDEQMGVTSEDAV